MGTLLGVCVTLISAACADGLIGVDPLSIEAAPVQSASKLGSGGTVDVVCSTSYATPGGPYAYGYGRLTVKLSAASQAADGSTRPYRYRGYAEGQRVVLAANCTIPNTERAFRQMNQRFGVKEAHAGRGWNDRGGATTRSDYTLPPLTVNACRYGGDYPECNPPPPTSGTERDNPPCWNDYGCDSGSGGSPTGGSDPEPPPEEEGDGTGRPECKRDEQGVCITRRLSLAEWDRLRLRVDQLKETSAECAGAKQILRDLMAAGPEARRIRFWDGYDLNGINPVTGEREQRYGQNLSDAQGRYIEYDSHWVWNDPDLIVHEALHYYLHVNNIPIFGQANESWVRDKATTCI